MLEEYIYEIASVNPAPIKIQMFESLNCPRCDIDLIEVLEIDLKKFEVGDDTTIYCDGCDLNIKLKVKLLYFQKP
jgi:hypothetical protein